MTDDTPLVTQMDILIPRLGQKVRVAPHADNSEEWNDSEWFVVGLTTERGRPGVNVWIGPEYPIKTDGPTDGFWVNRWPRPDDLVWSDLAASQSSAERIAELEGKMREALRIAKLVEGGIEDAQDRRTASESCAALIAHLEAILSQKDKGRD
jgi:hypothetical protein